MKKVVLSILSFIIFFSIICGFDVIKANHKNDKKVSEDKIKEAWIQELKKVKHPTEFFYEVYTNKHVDFQDFGYEIVEEKEMKNFHLIEIVKKGEKPSPSLRIENLKRQIEYFNSMTHLTLEKPIPVLIVNINVLSKDKKERLLGGHKDGVIVLYKRSQNDSNKDFVKTFMHELGHLVEEKILQRAYFDEYEKMRLSKLPFYHEKIQKVELENGQYEYSYSPFEIFAEDFAYVFTNPSERIYENKTQADLLSEKQFNWFKNMILNKMKEIEAK